MRVVTLYPKLIETRGRAREQEGGRNRLCQWSWLCFTGVTSTLSTFIRYCRCATGTVVQVPGSEKVGTVCNTLIKAVNLCSTNNVVICNKN